MFCVIVSVMGEVSLSKVVFILTESCLMVRNFVRLINELIWNEDKLCIEEPLL